MATPSKFDAIKNPGPQLTKAAKASLYRFDDVAESASEEHVAMHMESRYDRNPVAICAPKRNHNSRLKTMLDAARR